MMYRSQRTLPSLRRGLAILFVAILAAATLASTRPAVAFDLSRWPDPATSQVDLGFPETR